MRRYQNLDKIISFILITVFLLNYFPLALLADSVSGNESEYIIEDGVLLTYLGEGGEVEIPSGVLEIGTGAFQNNTAVTKVIFNDELKKIGAYAFAKSGLTGNLEIPESVESIGNYAFQSCTGLTGDLEIPGNVESIGTNAFQSSTKISGITLNEGLKSIGNDAFQSCTGLTGDLEIPGSVKSIGGSAFQNCSGLNGTLTLNEGVESIQTCEYIKPQTHMVSALARNGKQVLHFHRPLSMILTMCFEIGFVLDGIKEPVFSKSADANPNKFDWYEIPPSIIVRLRKV